jgi:hypothetical protein
MLCLLCSGSVDPSKDRLVAYYQRLGAQTKENFSIGSECNKMYVSDNVKFFFLSNQKNEAHDSIGESYHG